LLIMDIAAGDGWDKLCPFVERDIPPMPFPHQNPRGRRTRSTWDWPWRRSRP
jgi:hypothetical protein